MTIPATIGVSSRSHCMDTPVRHRELRLTALKVKVTRAIGRCRKLASFGVHHGQFDPLELHDAGSRDPIALARSS